MFSCSRRARPRLTPMSKPAQETFTSDDVELVVLPEIGARWHRLRAFGQDLLRTPRDLNEHVRDTFFWGAYPMAPWAGRVDATSLVVANQTVTLEPNFPDGTAIHGQVFGVPWTEDQEGVFRIEAGGDGWPWPYEVTMAVDVHDAGMGHPLRYDAERLRILLERHQAATGSAKATALLADWPNALQHFVKVVPNEFRKALEYQGAETVAVAAE